MKEKNNYALFASGVRVLFHKALKMQFYIFILFLFTLFSVSTYAQQAKLTLNLEDVMLRKAISDIENTSDYVFLITDEINSELNQRRSVHATDQSIQDILKELFKDTSLAFNIVERQVSIYKNPVPRPAAPEVVTLTQQQKKTVTGKVVDEKGEPVFAVTVVEKGTTNGTVTDENGKFSFQVAPNAVLQITSVGYIMQEINTEGKTEFDIILVEDTKVLDEVVVVAYGEQKRSAFTGAAVVVPSQIINRRPVTNVMNALEGLAPGVMMELTSGSPTGTPSFRIRGVSSINAGRSPLIILDGVPYEGGWNNINPNDVESLTVLKDAASTAIYGARGGNGVILITTKKAGIDRTLNVTLDSRFAISQVRENDLYEVIKNPGEFYELQYLALYNYYQDVAGYNSFAAHNAANASWLKNSDQGGVGYLMYTVPAGEQLIGYNGRLNPNAILGRTVTGSDGKTYYLYPDDWVDETYNRGLRQDYNLGISGGAENLRMLASFGYTNDQGITDAAFFDRLTGRLKSMLNARKWLRINANVDISLAKYVNNTDYSDNTNNIFSNANRVAPIYPIFIRDVEGNIISDENGKVYDYGDGTYNGGVSRPINTGSNRLQEALIQTREYSSNKVGTQLQADFILTKELTVSLNTAYDERNQRYVSTRQPFYGSSFPGGSSSISAPKNTTLNLQQLINYNKRINDHTLKVTLLHEYFVSNSYSLSGSKSNMFNYFDNQELAGAIIMTSTNSYFNNYQSEGFGGRILYDFLNKYNLDASYRHDASSRFHPDYRWGNFFSFGGAYLISREDFFDIPWINELKLKLSFGQNGNDQIGNHRYVDTYNLENLDGEIAVTFRDRGNKHITWETRTAINTGTEFILFGGRLRGSIDYYNNKTTNMLASISVPYSLGFSSFYDNVGSLRNSGVELDFRGDVIRTHDFLWTLYASASMNKNRILELAPERRGELLYDVDGKEVARGYSSGNYFYGEGLEFRTWYLKKFAGINESGQAMWYVRDEATGQISTTTVNSTATYFACGSSQPKVYGGFGGSFAWKSLELSYSFAYRLGGYGYDSGYSTLMTGPYNGHTGYNFHKDVKKSWTLDNKSTEFARWQYDDRYFTASSDRWLTKADYLNFQNITLSYQLPGNIVSKMGVEGLVVSAGVDNLMLLSHRKGFIPGRDFDGSVDFGYFPEMSRFMLNLNIKF